MIECLKFDFQKMCLICFDLLVFGQLLITDLLFIGVLLLNQSLAGLCSSRAISLDIFLSTEV